MSDHGGLTGLVGVMRGLFGMHVGFFGVRLVRCFSVGGLFGSGSSSTW